ncbi:hypothetical protein [Paractinoplanes atraurantiacus]|uniref:Uncharacterized protein n=1 Tax=Paractinoplanes atraurantiacus TaxID=1036182 RepID=A0A285KN52_9ACTN|nr:hypothetical protein [Actinoplanes atraurantiacus]SNY72806.1 hypothetical protein SAMN05421748_14419 [Actinoplanes atraurantiacus]
MSAQESLPDRIADRASRIADTRAPGLNDFVRSVVLAAFGCTGPHDNAPATRHACPVHGSPRRRPAATTDVLPSQAVSWENDPYDGYTDSERREGVQEALRAAAEFGRSFRGELAATVRRGENAREHLLDSIQHAELAGGLTADEMQLARNALAAQAYALQLLYAASNHVGDQPD